MNAETRRKEILKTIQETNQIPISASKLAKEFDVSRQVIVGDISLLRAQGSDIIATARGYIIPDNISNNHYSAKIVSKHQPNKTQEELYTIVDLGGVVLNVIVEHELYGEITGYLNLTTRNDVDTFLEKNKTSDDKLLSELTDGLHLHTVLCRDRDHFEEIYQNLKEKDLLFE